MNKLKIKTQYRKFLVLFNMLNSTSGKLSTHIKSTILPPIPSDSSLSTATIVCLVSLSLPPPPAPVHLMFLSSTIVMFLPMPLSFPSFLSLMPHRSTHVYIISPPSLLHPLSMSCFSFVTPPLPSPPFPSSSVTPSPSFLEVL